MSSNRFRVSESEPRVPRTSAWPRGVLPVAAMIGVAFMCSVIITPLYPLYEKSFHFSSLVLTLVYSTYAIGNLVALLVFGQLSDQLGRKRVAVPALGILAISASMFLFASGSAWLFFGRLFTGLAVGILSSIGTAWLAEQYGPSRRPTATVVAAVANLSGIALGPLIGGLLAQYAPAPLRSPLIAYLLVLVVVAIFVVPVTETRSTTVGSFREIRFRLRVGLPRERVGAFIAPAITGFVVFALGGLYFALIPGIAQHELHEHDAAVGGFLVFEFGIFAAAFVVIGRRLRPATAMTTGLLLLLPAVVLVTAAQGLGSLPLLLLASAVGGTTLAFGYRGSLQVVNEIAPDARRGQLVASYLIACFLGNSVPVIGIGVLSVFTDPLVAGIAFACTLGVLAILALVWFRTVGAERRHAA